MHHGIDERTRPRARAKFDKRGQKEVEAYGECFAIAPGAICRAQCLCLARIKGWCWGHFEIDDDVDGDDENGIDIGSSAVA